MPTELRPMSGDLAERQCDGREQGAPWENPSRTRGLKAAGLRKTVTEAWDVLETCFCGNKDHGWFLKS